MKKVIFYIVKMLKRNKLLSFILFFALIIRLVGIWPNIGHPDEGVLQVYSWKLVDSVISKFDFNPHIYKYGTLNFYLHALVSLPVFLAYYLLKIIEPVFSQSPILSFSQIHTLAISDIDEILFIVGRSLTAVLGTATVLVTYLIGKRLFSKQVGLIAALLISITPTHVKDSHYVTTDIPMVLFILMSFYFLVRLIEDKRVKWYILAGIFIGISATTKFFPIAFLAYPVAIVLSLNKNNKALVKIVLSLMAIFVGIFIGLPFLFLDPNGLTNFMVDLGKYALPWYGTSVTTFIFALPKYVLTLGRTNLPPITTLLPIKFQPFFVNFLLTQAYGLIPTLVSILGLILLFIKDKRKFLLLAIIPLINLVYITSYVPVYYERLVLPTVSFLVFFAAYFIFELIKYLRNQPKYRLNLLVTLIIGITIFQPLILAGSASISCSQEQIEKQGKKWIENNIPPGSTVAYQPEVTFPSIELAKLLRLEYVNIFSLEEVRREGVDYVFMNGGKLDYFTYMYFLHFFPPPTEAYENSYVPLALSEYFSRADLKSNIAKSPMCDNSRIYFFKLPPQKESGKKTNVRSFDFSYKQDLSYWEIDSYSPEDTVEIKYNELEGKTKKDSLEFNQKNLGFTPPRLMSKEIEVTSGKMYEFSGWIKGSQRQMKKEQTIYLRIDYYTKVNKSMFRKISHQLSKLWINFYYGLTPMASEQIRLLDGEYNNKHLPGKVIALSPRTKVKDNWQQVNVKSQAPENVKYAILSVSSFSNDDLNLAVDDLSFDEVGY